MTHSTMKSFSGVLTPLILLALVSFYFVEPREEEIGKLSTQVQKLGEKLDQIQATLAKKIPGAEWRGDQAQFWSFRRKSAEEKAKLKSFHLENTVEMDVSRLLDELRPCTNLESIKLEQVELLGTFPNTTESKLLLPNLYEFTFNTTYFIKYLREIDLIFFKKSETPLSAANIVEAGTNIDIWIGTRALYVNHDFNELVLNTLQNQEILVGALATPSFKLRRLTVFSSSLNTSQLSQLPSDLTYLNLKYNTINGKLTPTTEFMDLLKGQTQLRGLHINTAFDIDYGGVINLDKITRWLTAVSFRSLRLNITEPYGDFLHTVETLLFDGCRIDDRVMERMSKQLYKVKKLAFIFNFESPQHCHNIIHDLLTSGSLPALESIFVNECERSNFETEFIPRNYNQTESFLEGLGLGNGIRTFELQRSGDYPNYSWSGRNADDDVGRVRYEFADWYKLHTPSRARYD